MKAVRKVCQVKRKSDNLQAPCLFLLSSEKKIVTPIRKTTALEILRRRSKSRSFVLQILQIRYRKPGSPSLTSPPSEEKNANH